MIKTHQPFWFAGISRFLPSNVMQRKQMFTDFQMAAALKLSVDYFSRRSKMVGSH
jgi:hypothetical protein